MRWLDEGAVDVLVELGCLVRLPGPFFSVGQTGLLFLAIEEHSERGVEEADSGS